MLLLKTIHGSRLYGLAHADSDYDFYEIHDQGRTRQAISGDDDRTRIGLSAFMRQADAGTPQALEAMFSELADPSPLDALRRSYTANTAAAANRYRSTIRSHLLGDQTYKRRRHGLRLALNLNDLLTTGRFNPTLSDSAAATISDLAHAGWENWLERTSIIDLT